MNAHFLSARESFLADVARAITAGVVAGQMERDRRRRARRQLLDAVDRGDLPLLRRVLTDGVHPDTVFNSEFWELDFCAIHAAVWNGHVTIVETLLEHGADVDVRAYEVDDDGETPLMAAAAHEDESLAVRLVRLLIAHGANIDAELCIAATNGLGDIDGPRVSWTAIDFAKEKGHNATAGVLRAWRRWRRITPKVRLAGRLAATMIKMMREAASRAYAPGGRGAQAAGASFAAHSKRCRME